MARAAGPRAGAGPAIATVRWRRLCGDDPVSRYNRFRHGSRLGDANRLRSALGDFGVLIDVVLFALGRTDIPPWLGNRRRGISGVGAFSTRPARRSTRAPRALITLLFRPGRRRRPEGVQTAVRGAARCGRLDRRTMPGTPDAYRRFRPPWRPSKRYRRSAGHLCGTAPEPGRAAARGRPSVRTNAAIPHYHSALQLVLREARRCCGPRRTLTWPPRT